MCISYHRWRIFVNQGDFLFIFRMKIVRYLFTCRNLTSSPNPVIMNKAFCGFSVTAGSTEPGVPKKPVIIMGVAKKVSAKKKGELMEQNQDALEYSSEEEGEDLKDTMASINSKGKKVCVLV